jgi:acyl carrier protein
MLPLLSDTLTRLLGKNGRNLRIEDDTDLIERGVLDSQALLDLILEVENHSDRMFDAERIDFEAGVTLRRIAAAFA